MHFASFEFLIFLAVAWPLWRLLQARAAAGLRVPALLYLLGISAFFYGCWQPWYLLLIGASTLIQYGVGLALSAADEPRRRKLWLVVGIAADLGLLGTFKYGNFLMENLEAAAALGGQTLSLPRVPGELPVGISFYTFQTLSYIIDLYWRRIERARSLLDFAVYVLFFPQLVAGPIVRAADFLPQLQRAPLDGLTHFGRGLGLILWGLTKKVALADVLHAGVVAPFFSDPRRGGALDALLALWAANFQVYCDFSGYSDVAVGAALLFGYTLAPNFNRPFWSTTPMEHWRRWHISLSTWLKDYLYIPLGGSRAGPARTDLALATTFLLGGVWHGAGWRFVLWGLYNGLLLVAWRRWGPRDGGGRLRRLGLMGLTFHAICLGLVFLHVDDLGGAADAFGAFGRLTLPTSAAPWGLAALAVAVGLHATPTGWRERGLEVFAAMPGWGQAAAVGLVGAVLALFGELSAPFFYFQF